MICSSCRTQNHGLRKTKVRAKPKVIVVGDYTPPAEQHTNGNGHAT